MFWQGLKIIFELVWKVKQGTQWKSNNTSHFPALGLPSYNLNPISSACVCLCVGGGRGASNFRCNFDQFSSPLPSESQISCSMPLVNMIWGYMCLSGHRTKWPLYSSNTVKKKPFTGVLLDLKHFMAALWKWLVFFPDGVFCLSHHWAHLRDQSKFLALASNRNANWKLHNTFVPESREQRQGKWECD